MQFVHDSQKVADWLKSKIDYFEPGEGTRTVGVVVNAKLVAAVAYSNFMPPTEQWTGDCEMTFAADSLRWFPEGGPILLGVPFKQFGVGRLTARIARKNKRARAFIEHLGFKQEGVMRRALRRGDVILYGMTRQDFEESKYGGRG